MPLIVRTRRTAVSDDWSVTERALTPHIAWADRGHYLFASPVWAEALRSLGATPVYAWSNLREVGVAIPVFQRVGFRVGFLGFPIMGEALDRMNPHELEALIERVLQKGRLNLVRIARGNQSRSIKTVDSARPDVWIDDLSAWAGGNRRVRRDLAFAKRAASRLEIVDGLINPDGCFALYVATVSAHGGTAKYSIDYFRRLASLATRVPTIKAYSAVDEFGLTRAFAVMGRHGGWGYYLHSAADDATKRKGIGDLLLSRLIEHARSLGCKSFSFMASPWGQPGLIKFKQKWGNSIGLTTTIHVGYGFKAVGLKAFSRWQLRHDRRAGMDWMQSR